MADLFIFLLHYYAELNLSCELMFGTKFRHQTIDIEVTAQEHSAILFNLLSAHSLSGCDSAIFLG